MLLNYMQTCFCYAKKLEHCPNPTSPTSASRLLMQLCLHTCRPVELLKLYMQLPIYMPARAEFCNSTRCPYVITPSVTSCSSVICFRTRSSIPSLPNTPAYFSMVAASNPRLSSHWSMQFGCTFAVTQRE